MLLQSRPRLMRGHEKPKEENKEAGRHQVVVRAVRKPMKENEEVKKRSHLASSTKNSKTLEMKTRTRKKSSSEASRAMPYAQNEVSNTLANDWQNTFSL